MNNRVFFKDIYSSFPCFGVVHNLTSQQWWQKVSHYSSKTKSWRLLINRQCGSPMLLVLLKNDSTVLLVMTSLTGSSWNSHQFRSRWWRLVSDSAIMVLLPEPNHQEEKTANQIAKVNYHAVVGKTSLAVHVLSCLSDLFLPWWEGDLGWEYGLHDHVISTPV